MRNEKLNDEVVSALINHPAWKLIRNKFQYSDFDFKVLRDIAKKVMTIKNPTNINLDNSKINWRSVAVSFRIEICDE